MKHRRVISHYCCRCLQIFRALSENPEKCTRCGAYNWNELKRYKEAYGSDPDRQSS